MNKTKTLVTTVLLVFLTGFAFADHIPEAPGGVLEFQGRIAAFLKLDSFQPYVEIQGKLEDEAGELRYKALTIGTYYRIHENVKIGAFYRAQLGQRHDDDWIDTSPGWDWRDTRSRLEHLLMADVSPRFLLEFLPGRNWVFMLKSRYILNTFNTHHSIMLRPGLTYLLLYEREPLFNFSLSYYLYFPLNFGETLLYKHWPQLNVLYHLSPLVKLELSGAYKTTFWSTAGEVKEVTTEKYEIGYRRFVLGLGVLFSIEP